MQYLGAGGLVGNSPNVDKRITILAIKINFLYKHYKIEHYKYYKHFTPFQKNITNIANRKKTADRVLDVKEKKTLLINFHVSKKENNANIVSGIKEIKKW